MEHLTKSQIVLLTLFVSFVASMSTGIVVVTLMQQAPEPVLQSITNVVERTIGKATASTTNPVSKVVVVNDEDLTVSAIERNAKSVVSFYIAGDSGDITPAGVGTIVSPDGLVVTDKANLTGGVLLANVNGAKYALQVLSTEKDGLLGLGKLTPVIPAASSTPPVSFASAALGGGNTLKVGQTAIVISGRDGRIVTPGLITSLETHVAPMTTASGKTAKSSVDILDGIDISQRLGGAANGAPIVTLEGVVVGFMSVDENAGSQTGIPVAEAKSLIASYTTAPQTPQKAL